MLLQVLEEQRLIDRRSIRRDRDDIATFRTAVCVNIAVYVVCKPILSVFMWEGSWSPGTIEVYFAVLLMLSCYWNAADRGVRMTLRNVQAFIIALCLYDASLYAQLFLLCYRYYVGDDATGTWMAIAHGPLVQLIAGCVYYLLNVLLSALVGAAERRGLAARTTVSCALLLFVSCFANLEIARLVQLDIARSKETGWQPEYALLRLTAVSLGVAAWALRTVLPLH